MLQGVRGIDAPVHSGQSVHASMDCCHNTHRRDDAVPSPKYFQSSGKWRTAEELSICSVISRSSFVEWHEFHVRWTVTSTDTDLPLNRVLDARVKCTDCVNER